MGMVISQKKKYIILLTIILVLAAITAGIYLFVNPKGNDSKSYTVDKYSDVTNWCDTTLKDETLSVDCKALLLNIDVNSCFEVQVITKDKELKDLTVCEKNDNLSYTNDVLGYKKLMPVDVVFTYTKEGILNSYSFANVSFTKLDDTYVQGIVNEDIASLVKLDSTVTTIKNSVNFCPTPDDVFDYTKRESEEYMVFYDSTKLGEIAFFDGSFYNSPITELNMVFGCESQTVSGYKTSCTQRNIDIPNYFEKTLLLMPQNMDYSSNINDLDISYLHNISIIYDGQTFTKFSNEFQIIDSMLKSLNTSEKIVPELYCSIYKLLNNFSSNNESFRNYKSYMNRAINENIKNIHTGLCLEAIDSTKIDLEGLYLNNYFNNIENNTIFTLLNRCINLNSIIK